MSSNKASFDARRAEAFDAQGVRADNIDGVDIYYTGRHEESQECVLCAHKGIKHLFSLDLKLTQGEAHFDPVGSSCIRSWATSLPVSAAQAAIIEKLDFAIADMETLKGNLRKINGWHTADKLSDSEHNMLTAYFMAPAAIREQETLKSIANKVLQWGQFASDTQSGLFGRLLGDKLDGVEAPICGDCGGETRKRSSRYGEFWGCTSYPKCRWTKDAKKDVDATKDTKAGPPAYRETDARTDEQVPTAPPAPAPTQLIIASGWTDPAEADEDDFAF